MCIVFVIAKYEKKIKVHLRDYKNDVQYWLQKKEDFIMKRMIVIAISILLIAGCTANGGCKSKCNKPRPVHVYAK